MKQDNYNQQLEDSEAGTMPSFFCTISSRESKPLFKLQELERLIVHDSLVEARTIEYRHRLAISKDLAREVKVMMPGITASAQMDGSGKELRNLVKCTHWAAVDVDNIPKEQLQEVIQRADADPHVMARYITVSGKGIRLLVSYTPIEDEEVSLLELFDVMIHKIIAYYGQVLGVPMSNAWTSPACAASPTTPQPTFTGMPSPSPWTCKTSRRSTPRRRSAISMPRLAAPAESAPA